MARACTEAIRHDDAPWRPLHRLSPIGSPPIGPADSIGERAQ